MKEKDNNNIILYNGDGGLGIGDWGWGIGDWAQSPIPNPQSPSKNIYLILLINIFYQLILFFKLIINYYIIYFMDESQIPKLVSSLFLLSLESSKTSICFFTKLILTLAN